MIDAKSKSLESSKSDKKHKKKHKKEKHKKSSKVKKEKRKKRHHSSDSDENEKSKKSSTPPIKSLQIPPVINLDDEVSSDEMKNSKELLSKLIGKRESENGNKSKRSPEAPSDASKNKKQKISTDPDELVNIIKKTIATDIPAVVSSASESEG